MLGRHGHASLDLGALQGKIAATSSATMFIFFAACFFIVWFLPNTQEILNQLTPDTTHHPSLIRINWRPTLMWAAVIGILFLPILMLVDQSTNFLYFQF
jgi:alginate O-acetyltransferase complex protein AlgI